jgi:hypothetical protein
MNTDCFFCFWFGVGIMLLLWWVAGVSGEEACKEAYRSDDCERVWTPKVRGHA